ncbi:DNA-3-methyladenine glycosylase 2 family protein [Microbacterium sp. BK668]|uniref:DNA-3-methyladenine glycosylase family protein n=1 Tax=Microbacterium sp. BK668 TaxID=2512118 RepID=UPI0010E32B88|nr:DNA-3-methyladenine glycosylase 2 family protein [Microbacterium sp. BK668]TDN91806.1 3-methyladenine DNA glycosylase/8-oxoguanine DNA glycosylase [Microbacterium sp. BK668]
MTTSLSRIRAASSVPTRQRPHDPRPEHGRPVESEYRPRHPLDVRATVLSQQHGPGDPTMTADGAVIWRACRTPEGVATLALRETSRGVIRGAAWGPGADWALAQLPALCGADDHPSGFEPSRHPLIADAHRRNPGLRLGRTDLVFEALASAIFEQKVTGTQAFGAWRRIVTWFGERAPGPTPKPMFAPPATDGWRRIPSWAWHRAGLEPPQSRTVVEAARRGESLVRAVAEAPDGDARERILTSLPGIGAWTSAETRIRAFGDPDAVSVGDYHLAHQVGYALTGARTDDAGMLELLAPWTGHRQRVIRLIGASGVREERRGPRLHPEDHRGR